MPQHDRLGAGLVQGVDGVPIAVGAREDDDADADRHQAGSPAPTGAGSAAEPVVDDAPAIDSMA